MKLMTEEIKKQIPKIGAQDGKYKEAIVYVHYYDIFSNWRWFITEYDGEDEMYGYVCGHYKEFGYVSLSELKSLGFRIEREYNFTPKTVSQLLIEKSVI